MKYFYIPKKETIYLYNKGIIYLQYHIEKRKTRYNLVLRYLLPILKFLI